jgi:hypothetical protein
MYKDRLLFLCFASLLHFTPDFALTALNFFFTNILHFSGDASISS